MKQVLNITDADNYGAQLITFLLKDMYPTDYVLKRVDKAKEKWSETNGDVDFVTYLKEDMKDIINEEVDCIDYNL